MQTSNQRKMNWSYFLKLFCLLAVVGVLDYVIKEFKKVPILCMASDLFQTGDESEKEAVEKDHDWVRKVHKRWAETNLKNSGFINTRLLVCKKVGASFFEVNSSWLHKACSRSYFYSPSWHLAVDFSSHQSPTVFRHFREKGKFCWCTRARSLSSFLHSRNRVKGCIQLGTVWICVPWNQISNQKRCQFHHSFCTDRRLWKFEQMRSNSLRNHNRGGSKRFRIGVKVWTCVRVVFRVFWSSSRTRVVPKISAFYLGWCGPKKKKGHRGTYENVWILVFARYDKERKPCGAEFC